MARLVDEDGSPVSSSGIPTLGPFMFHRRFSCASMHFGRPPTAMVPLQENIARKEMQQGIDKAGGRSKKPIN